MGNGNIHRIKILLASLIMVISAIADIYIVVNEPYNYVLLGVASLILLIAVFLLINGIMQLKDWTEQKRAEQYDNLMTSLKACYLQERKNFRQTSGKMNELDKKITPLVTAGELNHQKISSLLDILMQDQKKIAKLTVSRSKENANAIMNSNDKVIEEMFKMQELINNISENADNREVKDQSEEFAKVEQRQVELLEKIQQLEDSLKSQIETVSDNIEKIPGQLPVMREELITEKNLVSEADPILEKVAVPEAETMAPILEAESFLEEEIVPEEEPVLEAESFPEEEIVPEEEPITEVELIPEENLTLKEEPVQQTVPSMDSNHIMTPEEIAALLAGNEEEAAAEVRPEMEPMLEEEPMSEVEPFPEGEIVPEEEPIPEKELIPEENPVPQAVPSMDSNHIMTPEEIAALIGSAEEPLPEVIEEPIVEEPALEKKPAMPDLSDPNRTMSPEEIAALIANL